ncbi:MAG: histidine triad nucleotide-binding protein [Oscillospiraceae bacterium]|nr:histidine triad nucleotide-binding protein [Oscillospiraceae bacterium]
MDCLFCKIVAGEIPSTKVYEDDKILAFRDIAPQAPTHILVIPKEHIGGVDELNEDNAVVVSHIFAKIAEIARQEGLADGYRVVSNVGEHGCQSVRHLHFHILGGKQLGGSMA